MAAVIWTDVVQITVYLAGALVAVVRALALRFPADGQRLDASPNMPASFASSICPGTSSSTYTLWSGVIGGAFFTTASHGTDQFIVQRLLAARSENQAKLALVSSGFAVFIQFSLFLLDRCHAVFVL